MRTPTGCLGDPIVERPGDQKMGRSGDFRMYACFLNSYMF